MIQTVKRTSVILGLCMVSCASRRNSETSRPKVSNAEEPAKAPAIVRESTVILFDDAKEPKCTGTLVSGKEGVYGKPGEIFVFTARHCMVKVNDHNSLSPVFKIPALVLDTTKEVTWSGVLPLISTSLAFHATKDIAVIKVEAYDASKVPLYKSIPAAPADLTLALGKEGIIAGYGKTADSFSFKGPPEPAILRWGRMQYKQDGEDDKLTVEFTSTTSSTCDGDSGGPLYSETDRGWVLLGVISNSEWPCHKKFWAEFIDVRKLGDGAKAALRGEKSPDWTVAAFPTTTP
jgi:Trypsin